MLRWLERKADFVPWLTYPSWNWHHIPLKGIDTEMDVICLFPEGISKKIGKVFKVESRHLFFMQWLWEWGFMAQSWGMLQEKIEMNYTIDTKNGHSFSRSPPFPNHHFVYDVCCLYESLSLVSLSVSNQKPGLFTFFLVIVRASTQHMPETIQVSEVY